MRSPVEREGVCVFKKMRKQMAEEMPKKSKVDRIKCSDRKLCLLETKSIPSSRD